MVGETGWLVARTHPRAEGRACENLARQGYSVYAPSMRRWRVHGRQRDIVQRPLFPRYVFVGTRAVAGRWRSILSTFGVSDLVRQGEIPACVPESLVATLRANESAGAFDETRAARALAPGAAVRVLVGPFADVVGRLVALREDDRILVLLDFLGREATVAFAARDLAPA